MRREGWEQRLWEILGAAQARPYELGTWDCFRLACAVVELLTGEDRWPQFEGRYRTRREALRLIAEHGGNFEDAFDWFFGAGHVSVRLARRGDIVALQTADGEKHLGVCIDTESAFMAQAGLLRVPTLTCICCWRVG